MVVQLSCHTAIMLTSRMCLPPYRRLSIFLYTDTVVKSTGFIAKHMTARPFRNTAGYSYCHPTIYNAVWLNGRDTVFLLTCQTDQIMLTIHIALTRDGG